MPGNITHATPTAVMPARLARAFQESLRLEANLNMYPDGSSDRLALAQNVRHYFAMTEGLTASDWVTLKNFFLQWQGKAFYFYNLRETVPPFTWDPTGANPVGRYTVVFDGSWSDTYQAARTAVTLALREVI